VFSTGWTLALLAAFYWLVDVRGLRRWAFPLVVVGVNSMAIYLMGQLMRGWVRQQLETHLPRVLLSGRFGPAWTSLLVLAVFWTICLWMYRRKIFLRI
jgi:predicted acyltransferase